jgi:Mg-chelatase subunit ChlD
VVASASARAESDSGDPELHDRALAAVAQAHASDPPPSSQLAELSTVSCGRAAIVFVIDRSGSMTGPPIEGAKEGVIAGASVLGASDCVEVLAFDSQPTRIFALHAPDATLAGLVRKIQPGGGTEIFTALDRAHGDLAKASGAKKKHIVLLTDGRSPQQGLGALADQLAKEGATISTIALGSDADEALLKDLASRGAGRFFKINDPARLPAVFDKEVRQALK